MDIESKKAFFPVFVVLVIVTILLLIFNQTKKEYVITFDSNEGSIVEKQTINKNEKVVKPSDPEKEGYLFLYWELNGKEYNFDAKVKKSFTLKAIYKDILDNKYTVTFDSNGGTQVHSQTVVENEKAFKPSNPTRSGYTFLYWELNNNEYNFDNLIANNITLIAKWEEIKEGETNNVVVTFDSNGGSKVSSKTIKSNDKVSKPSNPTRSGYTFLGWFLDDALFSFDIRITKNITLIAKWEKDEPVANMYVVTFNKNNGTENTVVNVEEGKKVSKPSNPTRSGYTFLGWYKDNNVYDFNTPVNSNITLIAKWEEVVVYTFESKLFQIGVPQVEIVIKRNGVVVNAREVRSSSGVTLGDKNNEFNVILVDSSEINKIAKAVLNDGSIVNISNGG